MAGVAAKSGANAEHKGPDAYGLRVNVLSEMVPKRARQSSPTGGLHGSAAQRANVTATLTYAALLKLQLWHALLLLTVNIC
jgi:hypothetical protein